MGELRTTWLEIPHFSRAAMHDLYGKKHTHITKQQIYTNASNKQECKEAIDRSDENKKKYMKTGSLFIDKTILKMKKMCWVFSPLPLSLSIFLFFFFYFALLFDSYFRCVCVLVFSLRLLLRNFFVSFSVASKILRVVGICFLSFPSVLVGFMCVCSEIFVLRPPCVTSEGNKQTDIN